MRKNKKISIQVSHRMIRNPAIFGNIPLSFDQVLQGIADEGKPENITYSAKPFVRWVGGKRSVLHELIARLPEDYNGYYEPFIGGGALFFALQPQKAHLMDVNLHLVLAYCAVRDTPQSLIYALEEHKKNHCKEYYLKARKRLGMATKAVEIASLLIYLNKTCYNGLYRVNKSGEFNVSMGSYKDPPILDEQTIAADHMVLQGVEIEQGDFSIVKIQKGAFYYLDPPYHQMYDGYNSNGFGDDKHTELAEFCHKIDKAGGYFMLSNSNTELVRKLWKGHYVEQISASRFVSCKSKQRYKEKEVLIRNYKRRDEGK